MGGPQQGPRKCRRKAGVPLAPVLACPTLSDCLLTIYYRLDTVLRTKAAVDKKTGCSLLSRNLDHSGEVSRKERRKQIANIYTFGGENTMREGAAWAWVQVTQAEEQGMRSQGRRGEREDC